MSIKPVCTCHICPKIKSGRDARQNGLHITCAKSHQICHEQHSKHAWRILYKHPPIPHETEIQFPMESIGQTINAAIEFPIDFEGQKKADKYVSVYLYVSCLVSVLAGFLTQDIVNLLYAFAACTLVTAITVLPAWPCYKKNPTQWLQVKYDL